MIKSIEKSVQILPPHPQKCHLTPNLSGRFLSTSFEVSLSVKLFSTLLECRIGGQTECHTARGQRKGDLARDSELELASESEMSKSVRCERIRDPRNIRKKP